MQISSNDLSLQISIIKRRKIMLNTQISPIPKLPPEIVNAINNKEFAIFIGAGASISIGCKNWKDLAVNLVNKCYTTSKKLDATQGCIDLPAKIALLEMTDLKKVITICYKILNENDKEEEFFYSIAECLKLDPALVHENIYDELPGLKGLCITSNIDTHFDKHFIPAQIVYNNFNAEDIDPLKLYHIHGSILYRDTLVLTVKQYFNRYNRDGNFIGFLKRIFTDKTVLFIGYGLNEFEVLDFLFIKSNDSHPDFPKHFILLPYYSGKESLVDIERHYFSELGISVIPFLADEKGWGQLFQIIQRWNQEILQVSRYLHDAFQEVKDAAGNYDPDKEGHILQLIKTEYVLRNEFFKQLSLSTNSYSWLAPLKREGYFNPLHNPKISEGYYHHWPIMDFLETIAKLNSNNPDRTITREVKER